VEIASVPVAERGVMEVLSFAGAGITMSRVAGRRFE
jgi:hypothetical protein